MGHYLGVDRTKDGRDLEALHENSLRFDRNQQAHINYDKCHEVVGKLLAKVLVVQYAGDKAAADRFIERYTNWDENLHGGVAKSIHVQQHYRFRLFKYASLNK